MDLPDGTAVSAGMAFVTLVWDANPLLLTVMAIIATWKIGPRILRAISKLFRF